MIYSTVHCVYDSVQYIPMCGPGRVRVSHAMGAFQGLHMRCFGGEILETAELFSRLVPAAGRPGVFQSRRDARKLARETSMVWLVVVMLELLMGDELFRWLAEDGKLVREVKYCCLNAEEPHKLARTAMHGALKAFKQNQVRVQGPFWALASCSCLSPAGTGRGSWRCTVLCLPQLSAPRDTTVLFPRGADDGVGRPVRVGNAISLSVLTSKNILLDSFSCILSMWSVSSEFFLPLCRS